MAILQSTTVSGNLNATGSLTGTLGVSGALGQFGQLTASSALIQNNLTVIGTASIGQLNTVQQQSLLIGDKFITILSGGVDHSGIDGAGILWGTSSGTGETTGSFGEHAHILYNAGIDALQIFPGLKVSGSTQLTGSLSVVSGAISAFSGITGSLFGTASVANSENLTTSSTGQHSIILAVGTGVTGSQQLRTDSGILYDVTNDVLSIIGSISASSNITASNLAVNGGNITSTATTLNINAGAAAGTIVLQDNTQVSGTLAVSGNISSINGVSYTFPSTQGISGSVLTNGPVGTLSWSTSVLTASTVNIVNDSTATFTRNILFASTASGPSQLLADTALTYAPLNDTLTVPNVTSTGTITAGSLVETSSRIFKKEIKTLSNQLEKVIQLNPVSYVRKSDEKQELGLIAEEVGEIYPEFVIGQGLNYPKMVSVLIGAVKELNEKVDSQSKEIQSLKSIKKRVTKSKKQ